MSQPAGGVLAAFLQCRRNPSDSVAWETFLAAFHPSLNTITFRTIRQFGLLPSEEQRDLMQDVCMKLSLSVRTVPQTALESEEAIVAYLRALAANAARDVLRARMADKRGAAETVPLEDRLPQLATELDLHSAERSMLLRQVDDLLVGSAREKAVFWLYFRQGFTAREISLIPAVQLSIKGVESLLHRMTDAVRFRMTNRPSRKSPSGVSD